MIEHVKEYSLIYAVITVIFGLIRYFVVKSKQEEEEYYNQDDDD